MSLTLHSHPLSSFCHKVLIALYENDTPFTPHLVDLSNSESAAAFRQIWPVGKFPVLQDKARGRTVAESSIIIEYLEQHYPGRSVLLPADPDEALTVRTQDRFYDLHVHLLMQKIVGDRLRPANRTDAFGVEDAKRRLTIALDMIDRDMAAKTWAAGKTFTMADCSAAPALFYVDLVMPFRAIHKNIAAYLDRLMARPSYARALKEAEPYSHLFPMEPKPRLAAARVS